MYFLKAYEIRLPKLGSLFNPSVNEDFFTNNWCFLFIFSESFDKFFMLVSNSTALPN